MKLLTEMLNALVIILRFMFIMLLPFAAAVILGVFAKLLWVMFLRGWGWVL